MSKIKVLENNNDFEKFITAIKEQNKAKVRKMLEDGFDVNTANENGRTGLMMAVQVSDLNILKMLANTVENVRV